MLLAATATQRTLKAQGERKGTAMIVVGLVPLLLIAVIVGVVMLATHHDHRPQPLALTRAGTTGATVQVPPPTSSVALRPMVVPRADGPTAALSDALRRWQDASLLTPDQALAIEQYESALMAQAGLTSVPVRHRRVPLVAEALGYLGGTLGLIGLTLLVERYWKDMPTAGRLGLTGAAAVLLAIGGYLVDEALDAAFMRLRWFLWVVSAATAGLFGGVLAYSGFGARAASTIALTVGTVVAAQNAIFWAGRFRPVQQAFAQIAGVVVVGTLVAQWTGSGVAGLAVWATGALLLLIGAKELMSLPPLTAGVGGAALTVGAVLIADTWQGPGLVFLVLTGAGLLAVAAAPTGTASATTRVVITVVGALALLQGTPATIGYFAEHAGIATGAAVWLVGAGLLVLAARRLIRTPIVVEIAGGLALVAGAAVTGMQSVAVATIFGLVTAIGLIALGAIPGRVLLSLFGSLGLLINVPWAINHFFPGEGRVPLLILASGAVIVLVAVWLARMGGRFRRELRQ